MRPKDRISMDAFLMGALMLAGTMVAAEELTITELKASGQLTFNEISSAAVYRVEWTTNLFAGAWSSNAPGVPAIAPAGDVSRTVTVGVSQAFAAYRVVAAVTNGGSTVPEGMVLVPANGFSMGDAFSEGESDELPVHTVIVGSFCMDEVPVTKATWDEVADWAATNGYDIAPSDGSGKETSHPVYNVTWYECAKWCNARSEKEGITAAYYTSSAKTTVYRTGQVDVASDWVSVGTGYRLPTEAEWEKAARGGVSGGRFPWSDSDDIQHRRASYYSSASYAYDTSPTRGYHPDFDEGGYPYTCPAGSFEEGTNDYGLYDMAGTVWEWCWDWYDENYFAASGGATDPLGPSSGTYRVIRGGSWNDYAAQCRVAEREKNIPMSSIGTIGFRCVR